MKIDIIVPTYNRPDDIKKFITEIQKQTFKDYKVYIIDDCGDVDIEHLIPKEDDRFVFEKLEKNRGQSYVRNYALKKSSSEVVVFMDDDAWFLDVDALNKIIDYYNTYNNISCLMFDVKEPNRELLSLRNNLSDMQEIGEFIACGVSFKRVALELVGGFSDNFHSYGEETELSMRLIDKGYKLFFGKEIHLYHNFQPSERTIGWFKRFKYNSVRNDLLVVLMKYPLKYMFQYFIGKFISHLIYGFRSEDKYFVSTVQTLKAFTYVSYQFILSKIPRNPMQLVYFNYWKKVRF